MSSLYFVVLIGILLFIYLEYATPWLNVRPLHRKAKRDFQQARGTLHVKLLDTGLRSIQNGLENHWCEYSLAEQALIQIETDLEQEHTTTLSRHLIRTHLPEAEGVGEKLTDLIMARCFDGTLDSLHGAYVIDGVGERKQESIDHWLIPLKTGFPELLERDFPGKNAIQERYDLYFETVHDWIHREELIIHSLMRMDTHVRIELHGLSQMTRSKFIRTYVTPGHNEPLMEKYLQGVHHAWDPPPDWFEDLISVIEGRVTWENVALAGGNGSWRRIT